MKSFVVVRTPSTSTVSVSFRLIALAGVLTAVLVGACGISEPFGVNRRNDSASNSGGNNAGTGTARVESVGGTLGAITDAPHGGGGNGSTNGTGSGASYSGDGNNTGDASVGNENDGGISGNADSGDGGWVELCGEAGQACCGASCNAANTFCDVDGRCETCGGPGGACCPDDSCEGGACCYGGLCVAEHSVCSATAGQCLTGACENCGGDTQACCAGVCQSEFACAGDHCVPCGGMDQQCCAGRTCGDGLGCAKTGFCIACGGQDKPCCAGGSACNANLACTPRGPSDPSLCKPCGRNGEVCCAAGTLSVVDDACTEGVCVAQKTLIGMVGFCRTNCGDTDQDCCNAPDPIHVCAFSLTCDSSNTCQ